LTAGLLIFSLAVDNLKKSQNTRRCIMAHDDNGLTKGLLMGFIAGSAIGAITALLLAPKSGKELRVDIRKKADELKDVAQDQLQQARKKADELVNEGKRRSEEMINQAKARAGNLISDAEKAIDQAKGEGGKLKAAIKAGAEAYKEERNKKS
jgi:gas vesicle protein